MLLEPSTESPDVYQCTRLFKNAFKIKSTPEGTLKSSAKSRRLLGMASRSRRLSSPETDLPFIDKENGSAILSPLSEGSSPQKLNGAKLSKSRCPLEDFDPNSQDSGYGFTDRDEKCSDVFQFAEPLGVAPRRMSVECRSPMQSPVRSSPNRKRCARPSLFRSLSSGYESTDDGFNDFTDLDSLDETTQLPNGISNLLSGHIVSSERPMETDGATTPEFARTKSSSVFRRSLSLQNERHEKTPTLSKVRSCLFRSPNANSSVSKLSFDDNPRGFLSPELNEGLGQLRCFKRPQSPIESSPALVKKCRKSTSFQDIPDATSPKKPSFQRSFSETEAHAHIKSAIHRSTTDSDLTGDFSKTCVLPLAVGQHEDLKSISAQTLAGLIRGEFTETISDYKIVDCRYPYEYEAGHIEGALNLYSKELIEQCLLAPLKHKPEIEPDSHKRSIIVFHCEFSWERGPNLSRFLRNIDRQRNKEHYPALHYPELYLLHGGYQKFYIEQKELCLPQGYRPMRDPNHEADLRQFRSKSKSWQGEKSRINGSTARANLKRLGL
ncbi:M-phase inducer phosphatase-like isoform X2 [Belonocnema kinseyi]|uniref:M-phase inducer phosphatase-like isoform X2 n=1 Tax=Belonocnema kinseyi TaxID=2817044 RepID=UPI00143CEDA7|nr:M-phase inducer phosphatase-like isoform X2 [Belonocnema kinseyi]